MSWGNAANGEVIGFGFGPPVAGGKIFPGGSSDPLLHRSAGADTFDGRKTLPLPTRRGFLGFASVDQLGGGHDLGIELQNEPSRRFGDHLKGSFVLPRRCFRLNASGMATTSDLDGSGGRRLS
jgi:hypothetical protein